jgi:hypothetical protein
MEQKKKRAGDKSLSPQFETKQSLDEAAVDAAPDSDAALKRIEKIRQRLKGVKFPDSARLIREDRDR